MSARSEVVRDDLVIMTESALRAVEPYAVLSFRPSAVFTYWDLVGTQAIELQLSRTYLALDQLEPT